MNWIAPLASLIGAVVGVGSALLIETFRWNRDKEKDRTQRRREVYIDFLMALSQCHSAMRATVLHGDENLTCSLHESVDNSGIWRFRQSLSLTATAEIIELAVVACDAIADLRDTLIASPNLMSNTYLEVRERLWHTNAELREAMRADLGMSGPPDPETQHYRNVE